MAVLSLIVEGILGWSNKRDGVEFYHSGEDGRWGIRPNGHERATDAGPHWGHLLTDDIERALGAAEGRPVVVLVGERGDKDFGKNVRELLP